MRDLDQYSDMIVVPRAAVRLPLEVPIPDGFDAERPETWPDVEGHLEFVKGKLLYTPPCGDLQQDTAVDVARVLGSWQKLRREFVVGGNEAGMLLGGETRAADAAVWRRVDLGEYTGSVRRVPPVLAVEIQGKYDTFDELLAKAAWYLDHGVACVWLVSPGDQTVHVVTREGAARFGVSERLPPSEALPDLAPQVRDLLDQVLSG